MRIPWPLSCEIRSCYRIQRRGSPYCTRGSNLLRFWPVHSAHGRAGAPSLRLFICAPCNDPRSATQSVPSKRTMPLRRKESTGNMVKNMRPFIKCTNLLESKWHQNVNYCYSSKEEAGHFWQRMQMNLSGCLSLDLDCVNTGS